MLSSVIHTLTRRGFPALFSAMWGACRGAMLSRLGIRFVQKAVYDYRLWIDLQDRGISRTLLLFGERELEHKAMLERIVRPKMRIFDIGANIGYYAIMESRLTGPDGSVLAGEPSPSNIELLRRNLDLNGVRNVTVRQGAVSDKAGERPFHLATHSNLNTFHDTGSGAEHLQGRTIPVLTATVPGLAEEFGAPDLIRMDVEGHEVEVIRGLIPAVREGKMRPLIIFETHLSRYGADHDFASVLRDLFACGYRVPLAASSREHGTRIVEALGYEAVETVRSDGDVRKIFENVKPEDAVDLICRTGGLRTVLLSA
jgi:FkbM family methyltransferase